MTFNTALSGLRAANTDLEVTGNNIANASTMGFKHSRAEFGDVYASSLVNSVNDKTGNGVSVNAIAQQFDQGVLSLTGNSLDLAIDGSGFFILSDSSGATSFTRAGYFGLDESGFITNNTGSRLQGFLPTESGGVGGTPDDLRVQAIDLPPNATQQVDLLFNLDARSASPVNTTFNPQDADSFNSSTSLTVFDSQGQSHVLSSYFVKSSSLDNVWNMYNFIPDANGVLQNVLADGEISPEVAAATDAHNQAQAALNNVTEAVTAATTAVNSFSVANAAALTAALNTARASLVTASTSAVTPASGTEYQGVIDSIDVAIALGSNSGDAANVSEAQAILVELNNVDALTATAAGSSASTLADYTAIFGDGKSYFELTFGTDGTLQSTDPLQLNINNWNPDSANRSSTDGSTATVSDFIIDISRSTQFGNAFAVTKVDQNGSAAGQLNGLEINNAGEVFARYTNGEESLLGQVAMASFANEQGLIPQGESSWVQSLESGNAQVGVPLARNLGAIQSGALEESNVDLSAELVRLIVAQRNFQANAKTIETADAVAQTIINMR